jgi:predicted nucleic acid-binding protein
VTLGRVFVDTGAWFAVQASDDEYHEDAVAALQALSDGAASLVTTNHVVGETYTLLRAVSGSRAAATFLEAVHAAPRLERIFVTEETERRAFVLLARFQDHDFSFVDGTSFAVMRAQRIRHAFAFDSHFATAGFVRIPVDLPAEQIG